LEALTPRIATMLDLSEEETEVARRAAALSKADLATNMVVEMTSLQGIMGGHYARLAGEPEPVAAAIAEQYETKSATRPGLALALADRLDSLVGLFAVGLAPTGSNDPFALRRAAIQAVENLIANAQPFDLREGIAAAAALLPVNAEEGDEAAVLAFMTGRLEALLRDQGLPATVVRAVLAEKAHDPYAAARAAERLATVVEAAGWETILDAYARSVRITRDLEETLSLRPDALQETAARDLYAAYEQATAAQDGTVESLVSSLRQIEPAITRFFDEVLVMDEDPAVRENRLALLQAVASLADGVADLSQLEGF
ncbi:MAG: glycine--tRNA ligase subunit beta, partial [Candidatus Promineifilaceae bacterium]|nr:glycine--tRNA ligase subunit beta [Candidatus Promineifilaceae bacterium]